MGTSWSRHLAGVCVAVFHGGARACVCVCGSMWVDGRGISSMFGQDGSTKKHLKMMFAKHTSLTVSMSVFGG